jgi:hypothetical protein
VYIYIPGIVLRTAVLVVSSFKFEKFEVPGGVIA